jgi:transposase
MRQIREVLRLTFEHRLSAQLIARSCGIARSTVGQYLERAQAAGLSWPLPEEWDNRRLEAELFPNSVRARFRARPAPDFATVHRELGSHKHVTLELVWQEHGNPAEG